MSQGINVFIPSQEANEAQVPSVAVFPTQALPADPNNPFPTAALNSPITQLSFTYGKQMFGRGTDFVSTQVRKIFTYILVWKKSRDPEVLL